MIRKMSKEEIEEFNRRYEAKRRSSHKAKRVRVVINGVGAMEFVTIEQCADRLGLSISTVSRALKAGGDYGDFHFEEVKEVDDV